MTKEEYAQDLINNNTPEEEFITLMDTWDVDNSIMEDPSISDIEGDGEGDEEDEKKKKKWWKRDKKKKEDTELGKVESVAVTADVTQDVNQAEIDSELLSGTSSSGVNGEEKNKVLGQTQNHFYSYNEEDGSSYILDEDINTRVNNIIKSTGNNNIEDYKMQHFDQIQDMYPDITIEDMSDIEIVGWNQKKIPSDVKQEMKPTEFLDVLSKENKTLKIEELQKQRAELGDDFEDLEKQYALTLEINEITNAKDEYSSIFIPDTDAEVETDYEDNPIVESYFKPLFKYNGKKNLIRTVTVTDDNSLVGAGAEAIGLDRDEWQGKEQLLRIHSNEKPFELKDTYIAEETFAPSHEVNVQKGDKPGELRYDDRLQVEDSKLDHQLEIYRDILQERINITQQNAIGGDLKLKNADKFFKGVDILNGKEVVTKLFDDYSKQLLQIGNTGDKPELIADFLNQNLLPYNLHVTTEGSGANKILTISYGTPQDIYNVEEGEKITKSATTENEYEVLQNMFSVNQMEGNETFSIENIKKQKGLPFIEIPLRGRGYSDKFKKQDLKNINEKIETFISDKDLSFNYNMIDPTKTPTNTNILANSKVIKDIQEIDKKTTKKIGKLKVELTKLQTKFAPFLTAINEYNTASEKYKNDDRIFNAETDSEIVQANFLKIQDRKVEINTLIDGLADTKEGKARYKKYVDEWDELTIKEKELQAESEDIRKYVAGANEEYNTKLDQLEQLNKNSLIGGSLSELTEQYNKLVEGPLEEYSSMMRFKDVMSAKLSGKLEKGIDNAVKFTEMNVGKGTPLGWAYNNIAEGVGDITAGTFGMIMDLGITMQALASEQIEGLASFTMDQILKFASEDIDKEKLKNATEGTLEYIYKTNEDFSDAMKNFKKDSRDGILNFVQRYLTAESSEAVDRAMEENDLGKIVKVMTDMGVDIGMMYLTRGLGATQVTSLIPMAARTWEGVEKEIDQWKVENPNQEFPLGDFELTGYKFVLGGTVAALERVGYKNLAGTGKFSQVLANRIANKLRGKTKISASVSTKVWDKLVRKEMELLRKEAAMMNNKLFKVVSGVGGEITTELSQYGAEWVLKNSANWMNEGAKFAPFAVPDFADPKMRAEWWETTKITAGATLPLSLIGMGGHAYKTNQIDKQKTDLFAMVGALSQNPEVYKKYIQKLNLDFEKGIISEKQLAESLNNMNEMTSLYKELDDGLSTQAKQEVFIKLKEIKELEKTLSGNNSSDIRVKAEIKNREQDIEEISLDPYNTREAEQNRKVQEEIELAEKIWEKQNLRTDESIVEILGKTVTETENRLSEIDEEIAAAEDIEKIEVLETEKAKVKIRQEIAEKSIINNTVNIEVVENEEDRIRLRDKYGLDENSLTGKTKNAKGQTVYENALHIRDKNTLILDKDIMIESGRTGDVRHEGGHRFLSTVLGKFGNNKLVISMENALKKKLKDINPEWEKNSPLAARWALYRDQPNETKAEELLILTADALRDQSSGLSSTGIGNKIGNTLRRVAQNYLGVNVKIGNGNDIINLLKDYNVAVAGKGFTKAQKRFIEKGEADISILNQDVDTEIRNEIKKQNKASKTQKSLSTDLTPAQKARNKRVNDLRDKYEDVWSKDWLENEGRGVLGDILKEYIPDITAVAIRDNETKVGTDLYRDQDELKLVIEEAMLELFLNAKRFKMFNTDLAGYLGSSILNEYGTAATRIAKSRGDTRFDEEKGKKLKMDETEQIEDIEKPSLIRELDVEVGSEMYNDVLAEVKKIFKGRLPEINSDEYRQVLNDAFRNAIYKHAKKWMGTPASKRYKSILANYGEDIYNKISQRVINKRLEDFSVPVIDPKTGKQVRMTTEESIDIEKLVKDPKAGNYVFTKKEFDQEEFEDYFLRPKKGRPGSRQTTLAEIIAEEFGQDATFTAITDPDVSKAINVRAEMVDTPLLDDAIREIEETGGIVSPVSLASRDIMEEYMSQMSTIILRGQDYQFSRSLKDESLVSQQIMASLLNSSDFQKHADAVRLEGGKDWFVTALLTYVENPTVFKFRNSKRSPNTLRKIAEQFQAEFDKLAVIAPSWKPYLDKSLEIMLDEAASGVRHTLQSIAADYGYNIETGRSSVDSRSKLNKLRKEIITWAQKEGFTDREISLYIAPALTSPGGLGLYESKNIEQRYHNEEAIDNLGEWFPILNNDFQLAKDKNNINKLVNLIQQKGNQQWLSDNNIQVDLNNKAQVKLLANQLLDPTLYTSRHHNEYGVELTEDELTLRKIPFKFGVSILAGVGERNALFGLENDIENLDTRIYSHKLWYNQWRKKDSNKWGVKSFDELTPTQKDEFIQQEIQKVGLEAKKVLEKVAVKLRAAFLKNEISAQSVASFVEMQFASMNGLGKIASDVRFIPTMSKEQLIETFGLDPKDPFVLEHTVPANRIKGLMFNYIVSTGSNFKLASDLFTKDLAEYHSAIIPKQFDKLVNFQEGREFYKATLPAIREAGDFSLSETGRYKDHEVFPMPLRDVTDGKIYGTPEALLADKQRAKASNINTLDQAQVVDTQKSKSLTNDQVINRAINLDLALKNANKYNAPIKKIRVFDFDDTVARTKSNVLYTLPDGKKGKLSAEEFAQKGTQMETDGVVFDFSEFNKVVDGKKGPLFEVMKKMEEAAGDRDMFILTARSPDAAPAIQRFLNEMGINIPLENITGLADSSPYAKSNWIVSKAAEGYNDFYFADDHMPNVEAVKDVLDIIDVKGKVQQAKVQKSLSLSDNFNDILEESRGIESYKTYSDAKATRLGSKNRFKFFMPYSAEDFIGLLYPLMGKGKKGDIHKQFFIDNLVTPFANAMSRLQTDRVTLMEDFKALKKLLGVPKILNKDSIKGFTNQDAVRVWIWNQQGMDIPGLSNRDLKGLIKTVEKNSTLKEFAQQLIEINKGTPYHLPEDGWLAGTITTDLIGGLNTDKRNEYLEEWQQNVDLIFSNENLNKLEAILGTKYREALENILGRMKSGKNRMSGGNRLSNRVLDYINGSIGAIMFLNMKSALLQTISAANFINWNFNNPLRAGQAFANQKQYWTDFMTIMNSDYLVDRRNGLRLNINESEIANAAKTSKNKAKAVLNYLLQIGYTPTQIADSFAIASGGALYYRNRIKDLMRNDPDLTKNEAEKIAFAEFKEISENNQQTARPDRISSQQASDLGRIVLAFANTPMQYNRIIKKSIIDLAKGRGDYKTHLSKITYYGFAQNLIFNALQQAVFALGFGDEEDDEEKNKKIIDTANGMVDSILRGAGVGGVTISTLKSLVWDLYKRSQRSRPEYSDAVWKLLEFSPPIKSKMGKFRQAAWQFESKKKRKEVFEGGFGLDNPGWLAASQVITATTNVPLDRLLIKIENINDAMSEETDMWMDIALLLGWPRWRLEKEKEEKKDKKSKGLKISGGLNINKGLKVK